MRDDDSSAAEDGDRRYAFQQRWRQTITVGAQLLALRGAGRCLKCECRLGPGGLRRLHDGPLVERRVRADYCDACDDDAPKQRHADAIRTLLDALP